ncbi:MAG: GNAT family N-acetyltransferase [Rhodobacteraceae bacterium]|nr:GNAT family N-acetyltransferase [Paracoccaceae bacterium]
MKIRAARPADQADWRDLWQEFLAFYDMKLDTQITDFTWKRLMARGGKMRARLAVDGDRILGFAIYQHHPSTWVMGDDCYLEDLYVTSAARGQGVGRALINDLIYIARSKGWQRLYWNTDISNETARRLYDSITPDDGHIRYRLTL